MAFAFMGQPVPDYVDHIDGNPQNNRWSNLRACSQTQNNWNQRERRATETKRLKGTCFEPRTGKYTARFRKEGVSTHLGTFATEQEAHAAYVAAAKLHFGEFARAA